MGPNGSFARCRERSTAMWENHVEELAPPDFFQVKQETSPKAGSAAMWGMTMVAYIPTLLIFVYLILSGESQRLTESKIASIDATGQKGWECTMVSKVSATCRGRSGKFYFGRSICVVRCQACILHLSLARGWQRHNARARIA